MTGTTFPYIRYSISKNKFVLHRGKILGEKSFEKSIEYFSFYISFRLGEISVMGDVEPFLPIESYIQTPLSKEVEFEQYVFKRGFLDGKPMSKSDMKEALDFVNNTLMIRQKGNNEKYTSFTDAIKCLNYTTKQCSKHKENPLYGYRWLVKIEKVFGEDFDVAI